MAVGLALANYRQSLTAELLRVQNPDAGWSLSALLPKSADGNELLTHPDSDGYASGLVTLVLEQTALPQAAPEVHPCARALVSLRPREPALRMW